ncbi:MAG: DUF167 domain-containing protein [Sorangiineae bacterium]|nr:DUF167 domain-containing protein [Polyangiaceae bacterium]MEB2321477.1 DUF167 domain-containing protein [Sorangiineae bacterium]
MEDLEVGAADGALRFRVRVKPRASRTRAVGVREGALEVAIAAPPVDGEANQELLGFLARRLGVARSALRIVTGDTGRLKLLAVTGLDAATLRARLGGGGAPRAGSAV